VNLATSESSLQSVFLVAYKTSIKQFPLPVPKLGDDDNEPEYSSTLYPSFASGMADSSVPLPHAFFHPRRLEVHSDQRHSNPAYVSTISLLNMFIDTLSSDINLLIHQQQQSTGL
jgi:hypothetical protein